MTKDGQKRKSKRNMGGVPLFLGVRERNSDNRLIYEKLGWKPTQPLMVGIQKTYRWIEEQVKKVKR